MRNGEADRPTYLRSKRKIEHMSKRNKQQPGGQFGMGFFFGTVTGVLAAPVIMPLVYLGITSALAIL